MFIKQFEEVAQRAQNLGMEAEAQSAKNEIQALTDYMRNASRSSLGSMGSNVPTQNKPNVQPTQNNIPNAQEVSPEQAAQGIDQGSDLGSEEPIPLNKQKGVNPSSFARTKPGSKLDIPNKKGLTINNVRSALANAGNNPDQAAGDLTTSLGKKITRDDVYDMVMNNAELHKIKEALKKFKR